MKKQTKEEIQNKLKQLCLDYAENYLTDNDTLSIDDGINRKKKVCKIDITVRWR